MAGNSDLQEKITFICKNKKNVSHIQEYLIQLEDGSDDDILSVIPVLTGVFTFYTKQRTWKGVNESDMDIGTTSISKDETSPVKESESNCNSRKKHIAEKKVNSWLHTAYKSYIRILLNYITHTDSVQTKSCEALMEIIEAEYSINTCSNVKSLNKPNFPNGIFIKVVRQLMICEKIHEETAENMNSLFLEYDDICFYCLKNIHSLLENQNVVEKSPFAVEYIVRNTLTILLMITNKKSDLENQVCLYIDVSDTDLDTTEITKSYKHFFSSAWMALLRLPKLPVIVQKKILVNLDTKIMPQLVNPKLLIDFLSDCYDSGGVCSLLALNGLFVLITQYNLDYPEFYRKLYIILDSNIFNTRYKARFFYLLDLFLTSTHLPSYLVCAFVKKLSRIALLTPGEDLFMLLKFIKNLLIRHSSCRILIHRQSGSDTKSIAADPYNYEEENPFKSNASKSCLWELESLKSHYSKDVLKLLLSFRKEFPIVEDDISQYFDTTFESLISSKLDVDINEDNVPPFNYEKKSNIFCLDNEMWCI